MNAHRIFNSLHSYGRQLSVTLFAIAFLVVLAMMHGCTLLQTTVGPTAKKLTDYYCSQPIEARLAVREEIMHAIAPATIKLTCPGDADTVTPATTIEGKTSYVYPNTARHFSVESSVIWQRNGKPETGNIDYQRIKFTATNRVDGEQSDDHHFAWTGVNAGIEYC